MHAERTCTKAVCWPPPRWAHTHLPYMLKNVIAGKWLRLASQLPYFSARRRKLCQTGQSHKQWCFTDSGLCRRPASAASADLRRRLTRHRANGARGLLLLGWQSACRAVLYRRPLRHERLAVFGWWPEVMAPGLSALQSHRLSHKQYRRTNRGVGLIGKSAR